MSIATTPPLLFCFLVTVAAMSGPNQSLPKRPVFRRLKFGGLGKLFKVFTGTKKINKAARYGAVTATGGTVAYVGTGVMNKKKLQAKEKEQEEEYAARATQYMQLLENQKVEAKKTSEERVAQFNIFMAQKDIDHQASLQLLQQQHTVNVQAAETEFAAQLDNVKVEIKTGKQMTMNDVLTREENVFAKHGVNAAHDGVQITCVRRRKA